MFPFPISISFPLPSIIYLHFHFHFHFHFQVSSITYRVLRTYLKIATIQHFQRIQSSFYVPYNITHHQKSKLETRNSKLKTRNSKLKPRYTQPNTLHPLLTFHLPSPSPLTLQTPNPKPPPPKCAPTPQSTTPARIPLTAIRNPAGWRSNPLLSRFRPPFPFPFRFPVSRVFRRRRCYRNGVLGARLRLRWLRRE